jgi:hypothetical protein
MCIRWPRSENVHTQIASYLSPAPAHRFVAACTAMYILYSKITYNLSGTYYSHFQCSTWNMSCHLREQYLVKHSCLCRESCSSSCHNFKMMSISLSSLFLYHCVAYWKCFLIVVMPNMSAIYKAIKCWRLWRNKLTTNFKIWHSTQISFLHSY